MKRYVNAGIIATGLSILLAIAGCGGGGDDNNQPAVNISGRWTFTIVDDGDSSFWVMDLAQLDSAVTGTSFQQDNPAVTAVVSGTVDGNTVTLAEAWPAEEGGNYTYAGTVAGESSMNGTSGYSATPTHATWTAVKM